MLARHDANRVARLLSFVVPLALAACSRAEEAERATPQKIVVEVKVVELNIDKLNKLGFDWSFFTPSGIKKATIDDMIQSLNKDPIAAERFSAFLEALRANELAKFLAEPTIATLDGRPASFNVAGTTKLDVLPIVRGDGRVHLECKLELREAHLDGDRINAVKTAAKAPIVKLDSANLLERGRTTLLSHARTTRPIAGGKPVEIETLVFVRVDDLDRSRFSKAATTAAGGEYVELRNMTTTPR